MRYSNHVTALSELFVPTTNFRDEVRRLVDHLPNDAPWDDVLYEIYVRQSIEAGLADCDAGHLLPTEEVRRRTLAQP